MTHPHKPRIGLALGSGSARGWAHIGVIRALADLGIAPDIICGTSIGALVGAAYATQNLGKLEKWTCNLTLQDIISYLDFSLNGGMIKGNKLIDFFRRNFEDQIITALPIAFAAVATDLGNGREVWLKEGKIMEAVRASIALPGLFAPVERDGRWLVDGGLVNPVPVSLCRALGADLVIAVDLNLDIIGRHLKKAAKAESRLAKHPTGIAKILRKSVEEGMLSLNLTSEGTTKPPSMFDVIATSINIMQARITRSRLAGDPPEILVAPRLAHLGLMEFHRAEFAIAEGRKAVEEILPMLRGADLIN